MERVAEAGGDAALFEARALEDDVSLMRNWLDQATLERLGMVAAGGNWEAARAQVVAAKAHGGMPRITAACDAASGTLVLTHHHEGRDLDLLAVDKTLPHAHTLWQAPVELHTRSGGRPLTCTYDGVRTEKKYG
jgi:spore cortex formation protein SpoVR/YcgB (stage V sporulation)